jgi:hypothetical protein
MIGSGGRARTGCQRQVRVTKGVEAALMPLVVYALRFQGFAQPDGIDGNLLKTETRAPGCTVRSLIGSEGLIGTLQPVLGEESTFDAELTLTGATTFQEAGTITFGPAGHLIRFSSAGSGHLMSSPEVDLRHGAAIWRIDGGEGQFAGASGLIVSNFLVSDAGEMTDHQFGVVFVRGEEASQRSD